MNITAVNPSKIPDVFVINFDRHVDSRGYFMETFRQSHFDVHHRLGALSGVKFVQHNESFSEKGTIRGLHMQFDPPMGKLVRIIQGHVIDLALDLRQDKPTFGKIVGVQLTNDCSSTNGFWVWIPPGFAHGIVSLAPSTIEYLCTAEYNPDGEVGILPWSADIDWSLCHREFRTALSDCVRHGALVSNKDKNGLTVEQWRANVAGGS